MTILVFYAKFQLVPFSDYGFDGYQNSINLLREYYQQYACEFALTYYPFDTQVCHMVFALQVMHFLGIYFIFSIHEFSGLYKRVHCVEARLYRSQLYRFLVIFCLSIRWIKNKFTAGKKDLLEYEIQEWKVFIDNSGDMSVAEVKIVFRR